MNKLKSNKHIHIPLNSLHKTLLISLLSLLTCYVLEGQVFKKFNFPAGKLIIEGPSNLNVEGYDGSEVLLYHLYHESNSPDLEKGLERINQRKNKIDFDVQPIRTDKELKLVFEEKMGRVYLKIPKNLDLTCQTHERDYYYFDGTKTLNFKNLNGELEVLSNAGVDVNIEDVAGPISVVTYGNITASLSQLSTKGALSFDTYMGYVNLILPKATHANLRLSAKNGSIFSNLPLKKEKARKDLKQVNAQLGKGGLDIIVNTEKGGNIYLRKLENKYPLAQSNMVKSDSFFHHKNQIHYVIAPTNSGNTKEIYSFVVSTLFMHGLGRDIHRSSVKLGDNDNKQVYVLRKFDNFDTAQNLANILNRQSDNPCPFYPISKANYQQVLKLKSLDSYILFFKSLP